jgi:hypothetical protein
MPIKSSPMCKEHEARKKWLLTTFEYQEDGITVRIPNVYACVCAEDSEASLTPEAVDEIIGTVMALEQILII